MNKREVGRVAEVSAAAFLEKQGVQIMERNFRNRSGEIDIIGRHEGYLVFFEVKYRSTVKMGYPEEAVSPAKQRQICKVSDYYRCVHKLPLSTAIRYDVVSVAGEEIKWIKNAFPYHYR
ncbi:MAG: YraN family protein [Lachnospiraceae bacterium]|nr:YraN family protein [Lachnospiraceae bacterium]